MIVRQVSHALDLLEFFAERKKPASLADISAHFGWPRSSAYNILSTLASRGFLFEPEGRGRFYPTGRWFTLGQECLTALPIPDVVAKLVRELADQTGETVTVGSPSGQHLVFVDVSVSAQSIRYNAEVGGRIPIHVAGSGQALLSLMGAAQVSALLRKAEFERYGSGSPMSIAEVERKIEDALRRGWFESRSNFSVGLNGVSLPLALDGRLLALTVAGPAFRLEPGMAQIARDMQRMVSRHLGRDFLRQTVPDLHLIS